MRLNEFSGQGFEDIIEDEADSRGDANLITALEFLRSRSQDKHLVPKVRVDSLIQMIQNTGHKEFNLEALQGAFKTNDTVKGLVNDIKDDVNGVKYVYLSGGEEEADTGLGGDASKTAPEKTVAGMANRALDKRS
jgi:hypothetical protein